MLSAPPNQRAPADFPFLVLPSGTWGIVVQTTEGPPSRHSQKSLGINPPNENFSTAKHPSSLVGGGGRDEGVGAEWRGLCFAFFPRVSQWDLDGLPLGQLAYQEAIGPLLFPISIPHPSAIFSPKSATCMRFVLRGNTKQDRVWETRQGFWVNVPALQIQTLPWVLVAISRWGST